MVGVLPVGVVWWWVCSLVIVYGGGGWGVGYMGFIVNVVTLSLSAWWQINACFVGLYFDSLYNLCAHVFLYHFKY
jgi:hypothetical protein